MAKVMLIDDEVTMLQMVAELLRSEGHEVHPFSNFTAASEALETVQPEIVITDLYLEKSRAQGLELVQKARELSPPALVIVVTGFGSVETAVEAMRKGAFDYLEKPFKLEELKLTIQRALSYSTAVSENAILKKELKKKYHFDQIVGTSQAMQDVFRMVERVANTDSTVLILGESGTGKELIARALHFNSRRQFAPFVPINCSALPENLLESELFGHRKGSFTGAVNDKVGLFQEADSGTMFLDEIGTMPALLQSRLLRVLQEKEVRRVGDNSPVYVNVRIIAATNEKLDERIKRGTFREDLFYRLNVITIRLPSLRERREDIPLLALHFLRTRPDPATGKAFHISKRTMSILCKHEWPGNVRELENAIERACALCEGDTIQVADLPPIFRTYSSEESEEVIPNEGELAGKNGSKGHSNPQSVQLGNNGPVAPNGAALAPVSNGVHLNGNGSHQPVAALKNFIRDQEVAYINRAMAQAGGDKEKAAEILDISLATLYRKLAEEA